MPSAICTVAGLAGKWRLERKLRTFRRSRGGEAEGGTRREASPSPGQASDDGDFLAGFRAALGSREESLEKELQAVREQLSNAEKRISEVETAKETLTDQLHQAREEVAATRRGRQGEKEVLAKMERDIATSSKALEALQAERSALQAALAKAEQENQKFAEDEADLKSMRNRAETKAKQAKAERRSLESKLTELEAEASARTAELATALAAEKAGKRKLEEQLAQEHAARAAATSQLKQSAEALELEQVAKVESEKRWEQIAADLSKQATYPSSTEAAQLEQKLVKFQEEARRLEADHGQVVASLQAKSQALEKENQELKATATRLEKKVSSAQKEAEEELQQLSSSLKSEKDAKAEMEKLLRSSEAKLAKQQKDVSMQAEERQAETITKIFGHEEDLITFEEMRAQLLPTSTKKRRR